MSHYDPKQVRFVVVELETGKFSIGIRTGRGNIVQILVPFKDQTPEKTADTLDLLAAGTITPREVAFMPVVIMTIPEPEPHNATVGEVHLLHDTLDGSSLQ